MTAAPVAPPPVRVLPGIACEADSIVTVPLVEERSFGFWQQDIPREYLELQPREIIDRIAAARQRLGTRCIVLGHHYQREDVIQFADLRGDSYLLSKQAAEEREAEFMYVIGTVSSATPASSSSCQHA